MDKQEQAGTAWISMYKHGQLWTYGQPWTSMYKHGQACTSIKNHGKAWKTMDKHGQPSTSMDMDMDRQALTIMDKHGKQGQE
jgi:cytolysin (calcineurin-like family phosphatase)